MRKQAIRTLGDTDNVDRQWYKDTRNRMVGPDWNKVLDRLYAPVWDSVRDNIVSLYNVHKT